VSNVESYLSDLNVEVYGVLKNGFLNMSVVPKMMA